MHAISKHTPGTWCASEMSMTSRNWRALNTGNTFNIVRRGQDIIAVVWCGDDEDGEEEANARLIAAAPDLFSELEVREGDLVMLQKAIEAGDPQAELLVRVSDMLRETRAAIAKAEGR